MTESPRLFEAFFRGIRYDDVAHVASRICGICSISHSTASIQATEAAFGVKISEQTWLLRKLLYDAEMLESHVLHVLFLVSPDYLDVDSVFPLVATHPDVVLAAVRLKKLAYNLAEMIAGRKTHPITPIIGGFSKLPTTDEIKAMRERMLVAWKDIDLMVAVAKTLKIPEFEPADRVYRPQRYQGVRFHQRQDRHLRRRLGRA